jgi:hypothetical protein
MSTGSLLLGLALLTVAIIWIGLPLVRDRNRAPALETRQRDRLLAYYDRVLTNVRDLDEDFATDKMNEAEYRAERELWVGRGIQVLKALDQGITLPIVGNDGAPVDDTIDDAIEAAVTRYRAGQ